MKYLASLLLVGSITTCATAQETGVGVSVQGSRTIYIPISISENLRIEPSISYDKYRTSGDSNYKSENYELLTGIFQLKKHTDKTKLYYGARLGYAAEHYRSGDTDNHFEGYKVAPTMGLEYIVVDNLTVSGDVSFNYSNLNGNAKTRESTSTDTELAVRYYF